MVMLPAICDKCGSSYPSGINISNSSNVRLIGNICGRCQCGGMISVVDGHFNFTDKAIEILSAPGRTLDELKKLNLLINESSKQNLSPEQIAAKIKLEIPSLSAFANFMPKNRAEWYALAAIIVPIITGHLNQEPQKIIHNNIVNNTAITQQYFELPQDKNIEIKKERFLKFKIPSVNDPCYCGSGKKYKKCCKP